MYKRIVKFLSFQTDAIWHTADDYYGSKGHQDHANPNSWESDAVQAVAPAQNNPLVFPGIPPDHQAYTQLYDIHELANRNIAAYFFVEKKKKKWYQSMA